jgi:ubiquinone/menaquinone biosynthesis C-methylase UbiE
MAYIPTGKELIDPVKLLEEAGIRQGMQVADFGCGTLGHYVFPASRMVGQSGKVYAIDILKSVLSGIDGRKRLEGGANIEAVWGDLERDNGVRIPDGTADIGMLINNLFLSKQHAQLMKECVRMVKRGGTFVLVDWKPSAINFGPDVGTRVSVEDAKKLAEAAGLQLVKEFSPGEHHYGFIYRKP